VRRGQSTEHSKIFDPDIHARREGKTYQAYRWDEANEALVLVMSVYPASDCGKEMGHTEAYFVQPADGGILHHVDLAQLEAYMKTYP